MSKNKWTAFIIDVESDGEAPGMYNMLEFGAVKLDLELKTTFHGKLKLMTNNHNPIVLKKMNYKVEDFNGPDTKDPFIVMSDFNFWINAHCDPGTYPMFFSDNNGYDYQFINFYFVNHGIVNPFGHTSRNIADLYKGQQGSFRANFKKLRNTKHDHNPVNDAMGNAEALIKIIDIGIDGLKIK